MSQPIKGRGSHFFIGPKNTHLVEDLDILLPIKFVEFRSVVSEKKSKMSQPIWGRGGHLVFFFDRPKKHKLGRWCWDLASYQVSLQSVFQRRSRKCGIQKLMTDGRQKDGQRLLLRCTKNGVSIWVKVSCLECTTWNFLLTEGETGICELVWLESAKGGSPWKTSQINGSYTIIKSKHTQHIPYLITISLCTRFL